LKKKFSRKIIEDYQGILFLLMGSHPNERKDEFFNQIQDRDKNFLIHQIDLLVLQIMSFEFRFFAQKIKSFPFLEVGGEID